MIKITRIDNSTFDVTVESATATRHRVTLAEEYYQKLTAGKVTREELITESFEFLLEREPNTSILRSFDLTVIARYFPEYERVIRRR